MLEFLFGRLAKRAKWLRTALDVQQRFGEIKGGYLASAVSLPLFLSVFPLLLVAIAVLGFVTNNNVEFVTDAIQTYVPEGVLLDRVNAVLDTAVDSRRTASVVGFVLLLWSGLGVAAAIGYTIDSAWQLNGRGIIERLPGLLWGIGAFLILSITVGLTTAVDIYSDGFLSNFVIALVGVGVNTLFFLWTFYVLTSKRLPLEAHIAGAVFGGIGLELLKQLVRVLPDLLSKPAAVWGSIGVVFAVLLVLTLFGRLLVYSAAYNVVRWEAHHGTITMEIDVPNLPGADPAEITRGGTAAGQADEAEPTNAS